MIKWMALVFLFLSVHDVFEWSSTGWGIFSLVASLIWAFVFSSYWNYDMAEKEKA